MPAPTNTLLIEGSFEELADELAQYLNALKKNQGDEASDLQSEVGQLLEENKKDDVLKKLVTASAVLNSAPEKEFLAAYNLLIHLVRQSPSVNVYLPPLCKNVSNPITSSPANSAGLSLSVLTTIFNVLQPDNDSRYHVFLAILRVVKTSSTFENLKPQLKNIDSWLAQWQSDEEEQRKLYLAIADVAEESGEDETAYQYLIKALRTIPAEEAANQEARDLSVRALKTALMHPAHFDFQDLTALDSIQALRKSDPVHFELLEIFTSELLEEFNDFQEEHDEFIEKEEGLEGAQLTRKMRLLTLASLAAQATGQTRALPYAQITKALQIPSEEVELWVIDVIRAGLVEGKLSQLNQTFLIHRATYRVFGDNQWREVASRLDMWRNSLTGVLGVIRQEKENFIVQKEQEMRDAENKATQGGQQGGRRGGGGRKPEAAATTAEPEE
ncbi:eukaryotic translation initiation factor 3 subunit m [Diplodia corticola]|uniref:Eukaryotic translation initiation factor 3 subunit M n=1 Tax=Diplodia corticola TaxID=236234 RepID=A0A1J9RZ32_9PEZI|nr:eukaryotic translation initiation factor 3 subunit m [Diplodia corticola]OJD32709.1 eukaryotic translation initiation factor 3 subunit m [Diplodia corticola]